MPQEYLERETALDAVDRLFAVVADARGTMAGMSDAHGIGLHAAAPSSVTVRAHNGDAVAFATFRVTVNASSRSRERRR